jgi:uncharacterized protein (TIGR03382 family)
MRLTLFAVSAGGSLAGLLALLDRLWLCACATYGVTLALLVILVAFDIRRHRRRSGAATVRVSEHSGVQ